MSAEEIFASMGQPVGVHYVITLQIGVEFGPV